MSSLINEYQSFFNLNESQRFISRWRITRTNCCLDSHGKLMDCTHQRLMDTGVLKTARGKKSGEDVGQA